MANKILGIVNFEPSYCNVSGLEEHRPAAAVSALGRYRIIDFPMSNFANSGIQTISVYIKTNPFSIIRHINQTDYNINSKRGQIRLYPTEKSFAGEVFNTDLAAMSISLEDVEDSTAQYVVIAPSHFIYTQDFNKMLDEHKKAKNDITILHQIVNNGDKNFLNCDEVTLKGSRVVGLAPNLGKKKKVLISLETYIMSKELYMNLVQEGIKTSAAYWLRDIIVDHLGDLKVGSYVHAASAYCISSLMAYYHSTMHIRRENEVKALISDEWPIHTASFDAAPTLYQKNAKVKGCIVGNGCHIDGTVVDSVIGRNVTIKKGAVIKNSIVLPNSVIGENVKLDTVVVDKYAVINKVKNLKGKDGEPVYVGRREHV